MKKKCYLCGKEYLTKNEIALTKKLIDRDTKVFYCINCLAEFLEVDVEILMAKINEFKEQGCDLFK